MEFSRIFSPKNKIKNLWEYNPILTFSVDFQNENSIDLSERFVLYDMNKGVYFKNLKVSSLLLKNSEL